MKPIPLPPGEEVAPKLVRLLYFVGAGGTHHQHLFLQLFRTFLLFQTSKQFFSPFFREVVCTTVINKWKEYERKSMAEKEQQMNEPPPENPPAVVHTAVEWTLISSPFHNLSFRIWFWAVLLVARKIIHLDPVETVYAINLLLFLCGCVMIILKWFWVLICVIVVSVHLGQFVYISFFEE